MANASLMNVGEALGDLNDDFAGAVLGEFSHTFIIHVADKVAALVELGYDVHLVLHGEFLNELYDVRTSLAKCHGVSF